MVLTQMGRRDLTALVERIMSTVASVTIGTFSAKNGHDTGGLKIVGHVRASAVIVVM